MATLSEPAGFEVMMNLFNDPYQYEEGLLMDRKADIYGKLRHTEKKRAFIVDVIAMSNSARRLGRPARILLGISDNGEMTDLRDQLTGYMPGQASPEHQAREQVKRRMHDLITQYIEPTPTWDLLWGEIEGDLAAILEIMPEATQYPFRVKKELGAGKNNPSLLHQNESWIRDGESNLSIGNVSLDADSWRHSFRQVPYLLPWQWRRFFDGTRGDASIGAAAELLGYQDLQTTEKTTALFTHMDEFLQDKDHSILVVIGGAGTGKTTAIRRYIANLLDQGASVVAEQIARGEYSQHQSPVPLFVPLRMANFQSDREFADQLLDIFNNYCRCWTEAPEARHQLLSSHGIQWVVFLDGFDEVWNRDYRMQLSRDLRTFHNRFPLVKIVVSTRAEGGLEKWTEWPRRRELHIKGFSSDQVNAYISSRVDRGVVNALITQLRRHKGIWQLCHTPLFLGAFVGEFDNQPETGTHLDVRMETGVDLDPMNTFLGDTDSHEENADPSDFIAGLQATDLTLDSPLDSPPTDISSGTPERIHDNDEAPEISIPVILDRALNRLLLREMHKRNISDVDAHIWRDKLGALAIAADGKLVRFSHQWAAKKLESKLAVEWFMSLGIFATDQRSSRRKIRFAVEELKLYFATAALIDYHDDRETNRIIQASREMEDHFTRDVCDMIAELTVSADEIRSVLEHGGS